MAESSKSHPSLRPTPTIEDYLAILYRFECDCIEIVAARLAEYLEVSPPTVNATLKRMQRDGWLVNPGRKGIHLSESGRSAAESVIRRHDLTEWLLARFLKVPWANLHAEAHQIEHGISPEIETQMRSNLDDPLFCPHGNPLPGNESASAGWISLASATAGQRVIIRCILESGENELPMMQFLEENGLLPGTEGVIVDVLPFNQTLTLDVAGKITVLGLAAAGFICVENTS